MSLTYQESTNYLISLSKDGSIRVWNSKNYEQTYEFNYVLDDACCCICASVVENIFVGGFMSGIVRAFDVKKITVVAENRYHDCPIEDIKMSADGLYCGLGDKKGFYSLLEGSNNFNFMKTFEADVNTNKVGCAFSPDSKYFATIGSMSSCINVWSLTTLSKVYKIATNNSFVHTVKFSRHEKYELIALTCDSKVKFYSMNSDYASLRAEIPFTHNGFLSGAGFTGNHQFLITCGGDKQIRVWDYYLRNNANAIENSQKIVGHSSPIYCIAVSSDSKKIFTAGGQEGIYVWNFLGDVESEIDADKILEFVSNNGGNASHKNGTEEFKRIDTSEEDNQRLRVAREPEDQMDSPEFSSPKMQQQSCPASPATQKLMAVRGVEKKIGTPATRFEPYTSQDMGFAYNEFGWEAPEFGFMDEDSDRIVRLIDWVTFDLAQKEREIQKLFKLIPSVERSKDAEKKERVDMIYDILHWNKRVIGTYKDFDIRKIFETYNLMRMILDEEITITSPPENHLTFLPPALNFDAEHGGIPIDRDPVKGGLEDALGVFYGEEKAVADPDANGWALDYDSMAKKVPKGEMLHQESTILFKKSRSFKKKNLETFWSYMKDYEREKNDLPNKHYYVSGNSVEVGKRVGKLRLNSKGLELLYASGINTNTHNNLHWNTRFNC
jgi:WD40 repeat protein